MFIMIKYLILFATLICSISARHTMAVFFEWKYLNFTWPSQETYEHAVRSQAYIPENNIISGIKLWKNQVYLTVPRWKTGVPATLTVVSLTSEFSALLQPYPNWSSQVLDDCTAFQFVLSMEIDPLGRMWVLDNGRSEFLSPQPSTRCPPRLVILNLEENGKVLMSYEFPEDVVHRESALLNDIVLDIEDGGWAFITDSDATDPGLIVFSLRDTVAWKVRDDSMKPKEEAFELIVNGTKLVEQAPINGIALSPVSMKANRLVYYSALSSFDVFTVPTSVLKNRIINIKDNVRSIGKKTSQSDGLGMSAKGVLYFGLLNDNAVGKWDIQDFPFEDNVRILAQSHRLIQYPNSFAFDEAGRLWFISNKMQKFRTNSIDTSEPNFRVILDHVSSKNYQYYEDGSVPKI